MGLVLETLYGLARYMTPMLPVPFMEAWQLRKYRRRAQELTKSGLEPRLAQVVVDAEFHREEIAMQTFDERSEKNLATLHPKAQVKAREFLAAAQAAMPGGLSVKIISGSRSYAEQDALYAKGRTTPGRKVTNARGGFSNHNFGIAWDIGLFRDRDYLEEDPLYGECGKIGRAMGLEWGGDWKSFRDEPHYQIKTGLSLAQMRARVAAGKEVL